MCVHTTNDCRAITISLHYVFNWLSVCAYNDDTKNRAKSYYDIVGAISLCLTLTHIWNIFIFRNAAIVKKTLYRIKLECEVTWKRRIFAKKTHLFYDLGCFCCCFLLYTQIALDCHQIVSDIYSECNTHKKNFPFNKCLLMLLMEEMFV